MKKINLLLAMGAMLAAFTTFAQNKEDSLAIKQACLDYVEGWATGNVERISKGVSPELVKRIIVRKEDGFNFTNNMSASLLKFSALRNKESKKTTEPEADQELNVEVYIFDITGDNALVKTVSTKLGFFDYCQLAKFNGEWKIFNVLWDMLPGDK